MDVLQYIINHHDQLKQATSDFLKESGQLNGLKWQKLKSSLTAKARIDREYLFPEVSDLSRSAGTVVEKSLTYLGKIEDLMGRAEEALNRQDQVVLIELLVSMQLAATVYFDFIQSEMLPVIRSKMPTDAREELSDVFEDIVSEESEASYAMYA